jgi:RecT family
MNELINPTEGFDRIYQLAERLSKSSIIPTSLKGKPGDLAVILLTGQELNLPPMTALNLITVIQGRPELSAQGKIAVIKRAYPDSVVQITSTDEKATCTMAISKNHDPVTIEFSLNDAKKAGLANRDTWLKFPSTMLRWRAISQCARLVFPHILAGLYDADEVLDIPFKPEPSDKKFWTPEEKKDAHLNAPKTATKIEETFVQDTKCLTPVMPIIGFGKFKGKTPSEVPVKDLREWYQWLKLQPNFDPEKPVNKGIFDVVRKILGEKKEERKEAVIECFNCHESHAISCESCPNCGYSDVPGPEYTTAEIPF